MNIKQYLSTESSYIGRSTLAEVLCIAQSKASTQEKIQDIGFAKLSARCFLKAPFVFPLAAVEVIVMALPRAIYQGKPIVVLRAMKSAITFAVLTAVSAVVFAIVFGASALAIGASALAIGFVIVAGVVGLVVKSAKYIVSCASKKKGVDQKVEG